MSVVTNAVMTICCRLCLCACVMFVACMANRDSGRLSRLIELQDYEKLESFLVSNQLEVDSLYLSDPIFVYATDRIYSFAVGGLKGTLVLEFSAKQIFRKQVFFCDRTRWLLPLPDTCESGSGSKETFLLLSEYLSKIWSPANLMSDNRRAWQNGSTLCWDSSLQLVALTLGGESDTSIPWYLLPENLTKVDVDSRLDADDDEIERSSVDGYPLLLAGPDTSFGIPGFSQELYDSSGRRRLRHWMSIFGVPTYTAERIFSAAAKVMGTPISSSRTAVTWDLGSSFVRVERRDSATVQVSTVPKNSESSPPQFDILLTPGLLVEAMTPIGRLEVLLSSYDTASKNRELIFSRDRVVYLCLKYQRAQVSRSLMREK